jgi:prevent-host-death family protein
MITANIATAKNELSRLLRRVKRGESVIITDRNVPVARLQPLNATGDSLPDAALAALYESGVLTPPVKTLDVAAFLSAPRPAVPPGGSLAAAVLSEREEGR